MIAGGVPLSTPCEGGATISYVSGSLSGSAAASVIASAVSSAVVTDWSAATGGRFATGASLANLAANISESKRLVVEITVSFGSPGPNFVLAENVPAT